ncbi:SGNH/GDSL hydrolase family protein [Nocardia miyunensis]|uniref:SGNH/GDSL hydrolase family protein n=1 Tax=Nocardia miyunensis TaxID=282684 RepID=UPI00082C1A41|nr:SGNH/GDSL hydrolase family protein [Nocardia miyunensis]
MVARAPLVMVGGTVQELPAADTLITTDLPLRTRTLSFSNGGQGSGLSSYLTTTNGRAVTGTNFGMRWPFRLPADATSYTVKVRNYDMFASTNGAAALTLDGMTIGVMTPPSTGGAQTGNFNGGAGTTLAGSGATIPNTTSFLSISGVGMLPEGVDHVLGLSFHAAASTTLIPGVGQCWYWNNTTSAHNPSVAASGATSAAQFPFLDIVIEYTTTNRKKGVIVFGDSIPEGAQGTNFYTQGSANLQPTPLHMSFLRQWERRAGVMVQPHCLFASTAQMWANSSYGGYSRMSTSGGAWDAAIVTLGCNDIAGGTTFATLQGYYTSVINNVRAIVGNSVPLYALNIMPESFATGANSKEAYRYSMNGWLGGLPAGVTHCIDVDSAVRGWVSSGGTLATNTMDLSLSCDAIHPSYQGSIRLADAMMAAVL